MRPARGVNHFRPADLIVGRLPFPSPVLQMASQGAQAQAPTAAELILPHPAAGKFRH